MENLFEAIAILLIILFSGAGEIAKRMRERTKNRERPEPKPEPARTSAPAAPERRTRQRQPPRAPQREAEWTPEPEWRRRPQTAPAGGPLRREPLSPKAERSEEEDAMTKMFKELFGVDEPEIVVEEERKPEPVPPAPKFERSKYKTTTVRAPKAPKPAVLASTRAFPTGRTAPNPFFVELARRAETEPLRAGVLFSEILQKPRAFRRHGIHR